MYYLFDPERRAWWRRPAHGYTNKKALAGEWTRKEIGEKGYHITDAETVRAMMQDNRSFAVPVHDADVVAFLDRQTVESDFEFV